MPGCFIYSHPVYAAACSSPCVIAAACTFVVTCIRCVSTDSSMLRSTLGKKRGMKLLSSPGPVASVRRGACDTKSLPGGDEGGVMPAALIFTVDRSSRSYHRGLMAGRECPPQ